MRALITLLAVSHDDASRAAPDGGAATQGRFPAYVIAITGTSGAGKTTLVRAVARLLGDAAALFFDDYESTSSYPEDWTAWWRAGSDPDAVHTPRLAADLRALRGGVPVAHPHSGLPIAPASFVVVDEPFGRARGEMEDLVDFVACIDVPLVVALARRVLRSLDTLRDDARLREELRETAATYLTAGSVAVYAGANAAPSAGCDLVVDGLRDPQELAAQVVGAVRGRLEGGRPAPRPA